MCNRHIYWAYSFLKYRSKDWDHYASLKILYQILIQTVPYLRSLCLNTIIINWAAHPHLDVLSEPEQRKVLKRLSLDLDLKKALLIKDNDYWARRCEQKWKISNGTEYGASFRRMYLERLLEEKIENFVPNQSEIAEVDELLEIVKGDVIRVRKWVIHFKFSHFLFKIATLKYFTWKL